MPFFCVRETVLERSLCVTQTLDPGGKAWGRHVQQDVGTIHPVDRRDHGVKALGGPSLTTEMLLDTCMQKFYGPAHPVPHDPLACRGPQSIAGTIRAATIRSVAPCSTHQRDLAHRAPGACGVSDATVQSLAFLPMHRQTHGVPREPAMTTEKRVDVAPLLRVRSGQSERFRWDTA